MSGRTLGAPLLLLIGLLVLAGLLGDGGYVLIRWGSTSLETTCLLLGLVVTLIWAVWRILRALGRQAQARWEKWRQTRRST